MSFMLIQNKETSSTHDRQSGKNIFFDSQIIIEMQALMGRIIECEINIIQNNRQPLSERIIPQ